jgi:Uma2 family endonuclease
MATIQIPRQEAVVLHDISWQTYERLLADHADRSAPRFTYDRGALEIMSPIPEHERFSWAICRLVEIVAERMGVDFVSLGSTTFKREDTRRGFEPDGCFCFQRAAEIGGKRRIDLRVDPPPELVVEVEVTHGSLRKLPFFADLGVTEVWRYDGERFEIWLKEDRGYILGSQSRVLPLVTADAVELLLQRAGGEGISGIQWLRRVRDWVNAVSEQ